MAKGDPHYKGITIDGLEDLQRQLEEVLPGAAFRLMRGVTHGVAQRIVARAKSRVPTGGDGTLKRAIKAKRGNPRNNRGKPFSDVVVEHGAGVKDDAFYWRFVEYGTQSHAQPKRGSYQHPGNSGAGFFKVAVASANADMDSLLQTEFKAKFDKLLRAEEKKAAKRSKG
jgi:HK97 gp10 family phage protein